MAPARHAAGKAPFCQPAAQGSCLEDEPQRCPQPSQEEAGCFPADPADDDPASAFVDLPQARLQTLGSLGELLAEGGSAPIPSRTKEGQR